MPEIIAYTDGACSGNPGPGGWGVILQAKDGLVLIKERELFGGEKDTTNNLYRSLFRFYCKYISNSC